MERTRGVVVAKWYCRAAAAAEDAKTVMMILRGGGGDDRNEEDKTLLNELLRVGPEELLCLLPGLGTDEQ